MEKGEIAYFEEFRLFSTMFSMQSVILESLLATFQLSSAASLNLGWSQNSVLGNGLNNLLWIHISHFVLKRKES